METTSRRFLWFAIAIVAAGGIWSYWSSFREIETVWSRTPDYSHGYLVAPIAAYILWVRRDKLRSIPIAPSALGFGLLGVSFLMRWIGSQYYIEYLEQFSFLVWLGGIVWLLGGAKLLLWALPGIAFLIFMIPIPYRYEVGMASQLQWAATKGSCWLLQSLGQPAFATGNVINLGEHKLEVVQACSGLRMMMGFVALCTAYALLAARPMWEKILIVLLSVPISIACNILRIVTTGILYQYASVEWAHRFTHDAAGWAMMPVALLFLVFALWYIDHLFVEAEVAESAIRMREVK